MPRTRSLAWAELKIGVIAIISLALAAWFIYVVGGQGGYSWQQYRLKTRFDDVQGLMTGALVRLAGVGVGTVEDMRFVGPQVEVTMKVARGMQSRITDQSFASIGMVSLLGAPVVDIAPSASGTPLGDGAYVKSRPPIGRLPEVAERASTGLQEATRVLQDLRQGKGSLGLLFTDETLYRDLSAFVASAEEVAGRLNRGSGTLARLMRDPDAYAALETSLQNLADITTRLRAGEGSLGSLMADKTFADSLASATASVDRLASRIDRGEGTLGKLATDAALYERLDTLTRRLDQLVTRLDQGEGTAGLLLRDKRLYENMEAAVAELRSLVSDIRKDPKKYLHVKMSIF
jgi:phospholipid/cholesterol/gamma-HCH transport system substrate-binding protein